MQLNDDKTRRVLVRGATLPWVDSPASGVQRRMLYREGGEQAIATSLVRYAPGSRFPAHHHPGGEEFMVLEGTFQDERGDYPPGTYVRNPPGSCHAPASATGCVIFVHLQQFARDDGHACVVYPVAREQLSGQCGTQTLFGGHNEHVTLHDCQAGETLALRNDAGLELMVLSGRVEEGGEQLSACSWLRLPPGAALQATVISPHARLWIKRLMPGPATTHETP